MATRSQMAAVLTQLRTTDLTDVVDGAPDKTFNPAGPYVCVYDDPGLGQPTRYGQHGGDTRVGWVFRVVCCARTTDGVRDAVDMTRAALDRFRPDPSGTAGWLRQTGAPGPLLPSGPDSDRRWSQTLTYGLSTGRPQPAA